MTELTLIIGNKNYSSWSLRPWIFMQQTGLNAEEILIPLYQADTQNQLQRMCPSGKVPTLIDGDFILWESLAICEYLNEKYLQGRYLPADVQIRAQLRAICMEMLSGFTALRTEFPMNCRRPCAPAPASDAARTDITRIRAIWSSLRQRYQLQGQWLFGEFTIADAIYAPIVLRFHTYQIELSPLEAAYVKHWLAQPALQAWIQAGARETEVINQFER